MAGAGVLAHQQGLRAVSGCLDGSEEIWGNGKNTFRHSPQTGLKRLVCTPACPQWPEVGGMRAN